VTVPAASPRKARVGIWLVAAGLALQLALGLRWSPGTFVLSAMLAVPLVLLGCGLLGVAAWQAAQIPASGSLEADREVSE
jgi:hypothetical protein